MKTYTEIQVAEILPHWTYETNAIKRAFEFIDFKAAFAFMLKVAFHAEILDHHPEWTNVYNKVSITLCTHTVNQITEKDIELAKIIDGI
ncbi:MAG: 4a-hydroxytetrahydrobiopterin dehydratase [Bacteroidota bacterium]